MRRLRSYGILAAKQSPGMARGSEIPGIIQGTICHPQAIWIRFENFELAKKEELPKLYPQHKALIERMCKE